MEKKDNGLVLVGNELKQVTKGQRFQQWCYGATEPLILRYADFMLRTPKRTQMYISQSKPRSLPSGIIITTRAACRFIDFIYSQNIENMTARMAVTKCVCQTALKRCREPEKKDMALLYIADMYTTMKHTGIKEGFDIIETAEEAKDMVKYFDECGLMHNVLYCHSSGKWTFVMCNCDDEICVPFRSYMAGREEEMSAGPEIISYDKTKCVGVQECGKCLTRCILQACTKNEKGEIVVDTGKCLGCGLCVSTCKGEARQMRVRNNYKHEDVLTTKILLGEDYSNLNKE